MPLGFSALAQTALAQGPFVPVPIPPLDIPVPNGRWCPVFDNAYRWFSLPDFPLVPAPDERGFTIFFCSPSALRAPVGSTLILTRPDRTRIAVGEPRFYTGYNPMLSMNQGNGAFAAYVTDGADINQIGRWRIELKDPNNNNLSGVGFFRVAA